MKKCRLSLFWRIAFSLFLVINAGIAVVLGILYYQQYYGETAIQTWINNDVVCKQFQDNSCRIYNLEKRKYTTPRLQWVATMQIDSKTDSSTVFCYRGKRGYIDLWTGEIIIPAQYRYAWKFSEGLAAVVKDDKVGFINSKNDEIIPFKFEYNRQDCVDYLFHNGLCTMYDIHKLAGLINTQGQWVLKPQYDYINSPYKGIYRIVRKNHKYGVLGADMRILIPVEWEGIAYSKDGFILSGGGEQIKTDFTGTVIDPFVYDSIRELPCPTGRVIYDSEQDDSRNEEKLSDYLAYSVGEKWGIMNKNGKVITRALYESIRMVSDCTFGVAENGKWIVLDRNGNKIG